MLTSIKAFLDNEDAATSIEYCLIAGAIGVAIIVAISAVGDALKTPFEDAANTMAGAGF